MGAFSTVTHHLGRCLVRLRNRRHDRNDERGVGDVADVAERELEAL